MLPASKPAPAPTAAPRPPLNAAPAAAPSAVPTAALPTALVVAAWLAETPATRPDANCLHEPSSMRNWSKVLPVPGSAITLGVVGAIVQALTQVSEASRANAERFISYFPGSSIG